MSFTDRQKTDIRRFCGYPAYGAGVAGNMGWRFFQAYGALEFRLNNLSPAEEAVVHRYLATLHALEEAIPAAAGNLDTDAATSWTRNRDEIRDRTQLFDSWRRRLCAFLGIPAGPDMADPGIALVV